MMRHAFAPGTFRQAFAATVVVLFATTTTIAQENQQPPTALELAAQREQSAEADRDRPQQPPSPLELAAQGERAAAEADQQEPVVLKVIEFESMSVSDFLSAAELAGMVDRKGTSGTFWRRSEHPQRLLLAPKPDASLLFVRGPEKKVNDVENLAKKLDVDPDKRPKTLQFENGRQARRIPHDEAKLVEELLKSLGFKVSTQKVGGSSFLVFEETEEAETKQIDKVLEKLGVGGDKKETTEEDAEEETEEQETEEQETEE